MSEANEKVAEQLAKINIADDDYVETPEAGTVGTKEVDPDPTDVDTPVTDPADATETTEPDVESDSDVPDSYLRAAVHQGLSVDEVKDFWKMDPEKAEKVFSSILESTNNLSSQWSQLGQAQVPSQAAEPEQTPTDATPVPAKTGFVGLDIAKLRQEYDDDDTLIDDVVKPMNDLLLKMDTKLKAIETQQGDIVRSTSSSQAANKQAHLDAVGQQIDGFFGSLKSKDVKAFYGDSSDWSKLEPTQANNRVQLLTQADQIKAGAMLQGKEIDNETAMNLANMIMSSHLKEQSIISGIKESLTKREKGLSLKPSGSQTSSIGDNKKDKSEKGLRRKVGAFMRERGIKQY